MKLFLLSAIIIVFISTFQYALSASLGTIAEINMKKNFANKNMFNAYLAEFNKEYDVPNYYKHLYIFLYNKNLIETQNNKSANIPSRFKWFAGYTSMTDQYQKEYFEELKKSELNNKYKYCNLNTLNYEIKDKYYYYNNSEIYHLEQCVFKVPIY
jgi:hypothetical protein